MDPTRKSRAQHQTPPSISGKKRQRSPSPPPKTDFKRQALSADRSPTLQSPANKPPTPKPCEPVISEDNWHCSNCGFRCWLCNLSPAAPQEQEELGDEEERQYARMASDDTHTTTNTSSIAPSSKKRKKDHYTLLGIKFLGPRDQGFETHILEILGVIWAKSPQPKSKPPPDLRPKTLPQSKVIIRGDDTELEGITIDFGQFKRRPYDEHALSMLCSDSIILRDRWVENTLGDEVFENEVKYQEPIITSVRRDKWKPQKQGPSMPEGSRFVYDWEIEPDTSYAVSIRMFNLEYRKKLHLVAFQSWVAEKDVAVCPYLTVEYKCSRTGGKQEQATNQVVAAAVLWLYQRKNLRDTIGKASDDLSHFLITIVDSSYIISEGRLKNDKYGMRELVKGDLTEIDDLRLYLEWSNAIHAWGLGANAQSFKEDIETLVEIRSAQTPNHIPTPASTVSPTGPYLQKPRQSPEDIFHGNETANVGVFKVTT